MNSDLNTTYFIIFCLLLVCLYLEITKTKRIGSIGEKRVADILLRLPKENYIVLNDLMIQNDFGTSQIDHIVLSIYGIFVIETKNYSGWIYGGEKSEYWTKNMYGKKYEFRNPIKQNYGHIKALSKKLNLPADSFSPIVVFTRRANLKGEYSVPVIYTNELIKEIENHESIKFTFEQINNYKEILNSSTSYTKEQSREHVEEIKSNINKNAILIREGICPKCGGKLVLRKGRYGNFYGCSNYPNCRFKINQ